MDYEKMSDQEILHLNLFTVFDFSQDSPQGQQLIQRMEEDVNERWLEQVFASLSQPQAEVFEAMMERDASEDEIKAFILKWCPQAPEYMAEVATRYKRECIRDFLNLKAQAKPVLPGRPDVHP